jgi:hypothetical protein
VAVRGILYFGALVPFVVIYGTKERGLVIAPTIALIGGTLAWLLLRDFPATSARRLLYAAIVALVLGEVTWAFGNWSVSGLVGGAGIWLVFYVLSGSLEHAVQGALDRRTALEYAAVGLVGAAILLLSSPWRA